MPEENRPPDHKPRQAEKAGATSRSLSFQTALTGGFILLAMVAALVGGLGVYFTRAVAEEFNVVADQTAPAIIALSGIKDDIRRLSTEARLASASRFSPTNAPEADVFIDAERNIRRGHQYYADAARHGFGREMSTAIDEDISVLSRRVREALKAVINRADADTVQDRLDRLDEAEDRLITLIDRAIEFEQTNLRLGQSATAGHLSLAIVFGAMEVAAAIAIALLLGLKLGGAVTHAVHTVKEAAGQLGTGDYGARVNLKAPGILFGLTETFNAMAANIEAAHQRATRKHNELSADLKKRIEAEKQLRHDAMHDPLTKLSNRSMLVSHLDHCIERARRHPDFQFALFFLDLDRFKTINDSLGHHVGDQLLVEAAQRLTHSVRGLDTVVRVDKETTARLGGDEFAILVEGIKNPGRVIMIAERIQSELSRPFLLEGHEVITTASIGIALGSPDHGSANDMLRDADTAMYRAKLAGGAQHAVFDEVMHNEVKVRLRMENDLRKAVENQHFSVMYQPIVELKTGRVVAFESLIRWMHPEQGVIGSGQFVPLAEETGLIVPIGRWVLRQACRQLCAWRAQLGDDHPLAISVNVSPRQVSDTDLVSEVDRTLRDTGLDPRHLRLEITESMIMENARSINDVLRGLKDMGIQLYMDDFGTGYSSLSCLHNFPLDVLKIDREFVINIANDPEYAAVVKAIMTLAKNLKLRVTAEGIETPEQLTLVQELGCQYGQGYYFAKPLEPGEAWAYINEDSRRLQAAPPPPKRKARARRTRKTKKAG